METNIIWSVVIPVVSVAVVGIGVFTVNSAKYFTIREHQAYQDATHKRLDDMLDRIRVLEQTRPTTGELQAMLRKSA